MQSSNGDPPPEAHRHNPAVADSAKKTNHGYNVLFVCRDNSVYSIIAEGILRRWSGKGFPRIQRRNSSCRRDPSTRDRSLEDAKAVGAGFPNQGLQRIPQA